jgi:hypothetical protein
LPGRAGFVRAVAQPEALDNAGAIWHATQARPRVQFVMLGEWLAAMGTI